ncbi:MAG: hypothetical protein ABSH44_24790 [Bryobacteraceae bacterium]|jgi:hypothetical protein
MAHTTGLVFACVLGSAAIMAQEPSSLGPRPGGSSTAQAVEPETSISPVQLAKNVLHDQKPIWTFP